MGDPCTGETACALITSAATAPPPRKPTAPAPPSVSTRRRLTTCHMDILCFPPYYYMIGKAAANGCVCEDYFEPIGSFMPAYFHVVVCSCLAKAHPFDACSDFLVVTRTHPFDDSLDTC